MNTANISLHRYAHAHAVSSKNKHVHSHTHTHTYQHMPVGSFHHQPVHAIYGKCSTILLSSDWSISVEDLSMAGSTFSSHLHLCASRVTQKSHLSPLLPLCPLPLPPTSSHTSFTFPHTHTHSPTFYSFI